MNIPYLILHKVRGEPAFDVAEKLMIGGEEGWIIPTSGHRAYPYWVEEIKISSDGEVFSILGTNRIMPEIPLDWPDHYGKSEAKPKSVSLEELGL